MPRFYVVGGRAKGNFGGKEEWRGYERALVLSIDSNTGAASELIGWASPPDACPDENPSFVFKCGTLVSGRLWVCTQTEVMCYSVPDFHQTHYLSLPFFNDLHHVTPTSRGTLLIAVTGLDMVVEVTNAGDILREWEAMGQPLWSRFSRDVDYRKVPTTKPHVAHPNFVFGVGNEIWTTRCDTMDAVCLMDMGRRMPIEVGLLHDGHVRGDSVYFTVVTGHVVIYDWRRDRIRESIDLHPIFNAPQGRPLGWCRGIRILSDDRIVVGFSRIRRTKFRDRLIWVRDRLAALSPVQAAPWYPMPTRLACVDIRRQAVEWEIDLEKFGMNAVFSIHDSDCPDPIPA